jgi:hypothetical protein
MDISIIKQLTTQCPYNTTNIHYCTHTHTQKTEHVIIEQLHIVSCSILSPYTRVCTA